MKKHIKHSVALLLALIMVFSTVVLDYSSIFSLYNKLFSITANAASITNRDDGVWFWPTDWYSLSDWAGCNDNPEYGSVCPFHNYAHTGRCGADHTTNNGFGHNGFDADGSIIYAAAPGKLYNYPWNPNKGPTKYRGNTVVIETEIGNGYSYYSYYQHMKGCYVHSDGSVSAADVIGYVGTSGYVTGPHLHFGIVIGYSNNNNPLDYIEQLEGRGWILGGDVGNGGRILNNPAEADTNLYNANIHPGSVHYTREKSKVTVGKTHTHTTSYACSCGWYNPDTVSRTKNFDPLLRLQITKQSAAIRTGPYEKCKVIQSLPLNAIVLAKEEYKNNKGNTWYKLSNNDWVYSGNVKSLGPVSSLQGSISNLPSTLTEGQSKKCSVVVTSNYCINSLIVRAVNKATSKSVNLNSSVPNKTNATYTIEMSHLAAGNYRIDLMATDASGNQITFSRDITVTQACAMPNEAGTTNIANGKNLKLACSTSGATIYYTTNGENPTTSSSVYSSSGINLFNSATVKAIAVKGSYQSSVFSTYVTVDYCRQPSISTTDVPEGTRVTISSQSGAAIYYSTGSGDKLYTAPFVVTSRTEISAYAEQNGYKRSNTATATATVTVPVAPTIKTPASGLKIAQDKSVSIQWNPIGNAAGYTVNVKLNGVQQNVADVTGTSYALILSSAGTYSVSVTAHNAIGTGEASTSIEIQSISPRKVQFLDWSGNLYTEQMVSYGSDAATPPEPSRRGYNFLYWDRDYTNVTEDITINPVYKIITYTVTFLDQNGKRINAQRIPFGSSAVAPEDAIQYENGYALLGWNVQATDADSECNYKNVDSNMTVQAVVGWADSELPMALVGSKYFT